MSYEKLLKKTCTIEQKTETQGALGDISLSWSSKAVNVKTRYVQAKQSELRGGYQVTIEDYKFYFLATADIAIADRIVVDGDTFDVMHVLSDSSDHHKFAYARIIKFT